jgi:hypothetical protein
MDKTAGSRPVRKEEFLTVLIGLFTWNYFAAFGKRRGGKEISK